MLFRQSLMSLSRAPTLILLAMLLASCASSPATLDASQGQDLSALNECRKLDPEVPGPGPNISRKSDYRILSAEALGALNKANQGTRRRNNCENQFIESHRGTGS